MRKRSPKVWSPAMTPDRLLAEFEPIRRDYGTRIVMIELLDPKLMMAVTHYPRLNTTRWFTADPQNLEAWRTFLNRHRIYRGRYNDSTK